MRPFSRRDLLCVGAALPLSAALASRAAAQGEWAEVGPLEVSSIDMVLRGPARFQRAPTSRASPAATQS
jgi:uncharacterized protein (DUF1501 family)